MKRSLYNVIIYFSFAIIVILLAYSIRKSDKEKKLLESNQRVLLDSVTHYKTKSGLDAARIQQLVLDKNELLKHKDDDAKLIKELTRKNKLKSVSSVNTVSHDTVYAELKVVYDTVYVDSVRIFNYESEWTDVQGTIYNDSIKLNIENRESLIVLESYKQKRFLGIPLPVKLFGYKDKHIDVVTKNPNSTIENVEFITVK